MINWRDREDVGMLVVIYGLAALPGPGRWDRPQVGGIGHRGHELEAEEGQ